VQAFTQASGTVIALSDGKTGEITCRARAGSSVPEVGTALRLERTFIGLCVQSGKEVRCDDAEADTRADMAAILALGIRSMVVVPIKEEGRVLGVLAVFAPGAHAFSITHMGVLKTMADQVIAYLRRPRTQAHSPEPPAPPAKAVAVSAAASPAAPPAVAIKPAEHALPRRRLAVVPRVEPVRASAFAKEIGPPRFSQKQATISYHEQKESKPDFRPMFEAFNAGAVRKNRQGTNILMIGAAVALMIALAVEFSLIFGGHAAAPQPAPEARSSPGTPAAPAPASADMQPLAKNPAPASPAKHFETQPKREAALPKPEDTVELLPGPSIISKAGDNSAISKAGDNSAPASEAPAIFLGYMPASGSLSKLVVPVAQAPNPRLLRQSDFEPVTVVKKVLPDYPLVAKQNKLTGSVVVQGTVNKNGTISDLQLLSGSPLFRDAAFAAVRQWVFKPARLNGQPTEQPARIRLYFRERERSEEPVGVNVSRANNQ
jgi:TonB family protein